MIAKFRWIVKRMITRNDLTRKARQVNPKRQNLPDSRVIFVYDVRGYTSVLEVA